MELSRKKPEVTTAIVLETRVTKKDETHPVKLRITFDRVISEVEKLNRVKQLIKNTNKYISRIAGKIGLGERITTYGARHSYSTILKNSGASIEFISEQLGHSSTKVTSSYLDSFEDEQRDNMAKRLVDFKIEKHMQVSNKKPKK